MGGLSHWTERSWRTEKRTQDTLTREILKNIGLWLKSSWLKEKNLQDTLTWEILKARREEEKKNVVHVHQSWTTDKLNSWLTGRKTPT